MDRVRLLPMQLSFLGNINGNNGNSKGKFVRRLAVAFIILAGLGLLYVPAYHSAQGLLSSLSEPSTIVGSVEGTPLIASIVQLHGWNYNTSRDVSIYIHPNKTTTILNPKHICTDKSYLVIFICSAVENVNARIAIRNTWGNKNYLDTLYSSTIKLTFLLGQSKNNTLNSYIMEENNLYNDIIQENFYDTYNNLTLKSLMLLKWAISNCNKVTYVMKTDDDMFVNVPTLIKVLKNQPKNTETLIGSLICNARPIADPKNKWYTPKYMYSDKTYPKYLSGTGYVMSSDVVLRLYKAALLTPIFHLEDVYITGICAKRAGITPGNHQSFSYIPRKLETCLFRRVITAHKMTASNMYEVWNKLNDSTMLCGHNSVALKKTPVVNRIERNIGYFMLKNRVHNLCI